MPPPVGELDLDSFDEGSLYPSLHTSLRVLLKADEHTLIFPLLLFNGDVTTKLNIIEIIIINNVKLIRIEYIIRVLSKNFIDNYF